MNRKSQTAQARWSRKQKKRGRCARCGTKRNRYKQLCDFHQGQFTIYMRNRRAKAKLAKETTSDNQRDVDGSNPNGA